MSGRVMFKVQSTTGKSLEKPIKHTDLSGSFKITPLGGAKHVRKESLFQSKFSN